MASMGDVCLCRVAASPYPAYATALIICFLIATQIMEPVLRHFGLAIIDAGSGSKRRGS